MHTGGERIACPHPASLPDPTEGELDRVTCFGWWEVATPGPKLCLVLPSYCSDPPGEQTLDNPGASRAL